MNAAEKTCTCFQAVMDETANNLAKGTKAYDLIVILKRLGYTINWSAALYGLRISIVGRNHLCNHCHHRISIVLKYERMVPALAGECEG